MLFRSTLILATHQLHDVQSLCSHGAILKDGTILRAGSVDRLLQRGHEATIKIAAGSGAALEGALPALQGKVTPAILNWHSSTHTLHITLQDGAAETDIGPVVNQTLACLLEARVDVEEVQRGTSLEGAVLAALAGP